MFLEQINVGQRDDHQRPIRGSKIVLGVSKTADKEEILVAALKKYGAYFRQFDKNIDWILWYPDGLPVVLLPEGYQLFRLDDYKEQIMKEFKRINMHIGPPG